MWSQRAAPGSRWDRQSRLCTASGARTCVHTLLQDSCPQAGAGQKARGVLLLRRCLFSPRNTLKIPLKLDAELPSLVLASCTDAGIRVKFTHAYLYLCASTYVYLYIYLKKPVNRREALNATQIPFSRPGCVSQAWLATYGRLPGWGSEGSGQAPQGVAEHPSPCPLGGCCMQCGKEPMLPRREAAGCWDGRRGKAARVPHTPPAAGFPWLPTAPH